MTVTTTAPISDTHLTPRAASLVGEIRTIVRRSVAPGPTANLVAEALRGYLGDPALLAPEQRVGSADRYVQHVLHAEPDGSFSVVALVWLPGQRTEIHDHVAWCVAGVHQGQESERRYRLVSDGSISRLVAAAEVENTLGSVSGFAPPGDIHEVCNSCEGTAISIHVYGADVQRLSSSIRRIYPRPECERS